ncbi:hypothetical protein [Longimicrobium sp.]|uniref:hypothetical protein n=1 Tax=Longimicrobium sp. TaxID=2029185 RepID=UPI003B3B5B04
MPLLQALASAWREEASGLRRRYGLRQLASLCEAHAAELEEALVRAEGRLLTLREASAESGYSIAHLRVLLASGALTQAGRRGAPRVLSSELKKKGADRTSDQSAFDPAAAARQAVRASGSEAHAKAGHA